MNSYILFWKFLCDETSLSFNFSDPYIQKEALQTPVISAMVCLKANDTLTSTCEQWRSNFLGSYQSNSTASSCWKKEEESKILSLVSSVEMKITERVTYLIRAIDDIVT